MKKTIILALSIALLASFASAQETYSVNIALAANVTKLDIGRQLVNQQHCSMFQQVATCTQAQLCTASFAATGQPASGAACTITEANALGIRIYANTLAGREAFVTIEMVKSALDGYTRQRAKLDFAAMQGFCKTANQTQIDAVCTSTGLSAGCGVCDSFR